MYFEKCHDDSCQEGESQNTDRYIALTDVILNRYGDTPIKLIYEPAHETSPQKSDGDITRIVNTQVQTGVAVQQRPPYKEEGEHALPHQQREEDGDAERVGGMG